MDGKRFEVISNGIFSACIELLENKARDYSDNDDRLASFKMISDTSGEDVFAVWKVFFLKHLSAIFLILKKQKETVETVEVTEDLLHRICDAMNYLVLLYAITVDMEEK